MFCQQEAIMAGKVFLVRVDRNGKLPEGAVAEVFRAAELGNCFSDNAKVALKLHFGEPGNSNVWAPGQIREVVAEVKNSKGLPFLTDANVLYRSMRHNSVEHLMVAHGNGFSYESCGAPLIIADGLQGDNSVQLPIPGGRHYTSAKIAGDIACAAAVIALTHVTGHIEFGLGGAIKNLGMGSGSSAGKQMMHENFCAEVNATKCVACGVCVEHCSPGAISLEEGSKAQVDPEKCIGCGECVAHCPVGAIPVKWGESVGLQERTVEFCAALLAHRPGAFGFMNLLTAITGMCDCMRDRGECVCGDIGLLAGSDMVAVDQASLDLIADLDGTRKLQEACPGARIGLAQEYAEQMGLGSRQYQLVEI
jgi:uncharacterized protein